MTFSKNDVIHCLQHAEKDGAAKKGNQTYIVPFPQAAPSSEFCYKNTLLSIPISFSIVKE